MKGLVKHLLVLFTIFSISNGYIVKDSYAFVSNLLKSAPKPKLKKGKISNIKKKKRDAKKKKRKIQKITARSGDQRFVDFNGRTIINSKYAGKDFPLKQLYPMKAHKYRYPVRFNKFGYPDFSQYTRQTITSTKLNGSIADMGTANNIMRQRIPKWKQPPGFTWHHHQDGKTMQLVPTELQELVRHSGGASRLRMGQ